MPFLDQVTVIVPLVLTSSVLFVELIPALVVSTNESPLTVTVCVCVAPNALKLIVKLPLPEGVVETVISPLESLVAVVGLTGILLELELLTVTVALGSATPEESLTVAFTVRGVLMVTALTPAVVIAVPLT